MNLEDPTKPERLNPTHGDVTTLVIQVDNLGRGDLIHNLRNKCAVLRRIVDKSERAGWDDELRKLYDEKEKEIRSLINKAKLEK